MANIKSFPNNQNEYVGAEYVMRWLHGRTSGVFGANGNAAVAPVLDAMAVTVSDGNGWISNNNADGVVWWIDNEVVNGSKLELYPDMADAVLPRIDRVVVSWQTTDYVELPVVEILKGVASSNPVPPTLTNNNVLRQISLAAIRIPAGSTAITADMITDERLNPDVCGLVTENITADTSVVNAQFRELLARTEANMQQILDGQIAYGAVSADLTGIVAASDWVASGNLYSCAVSVFGLRDDDKPFVDINFSGITDEETTKAIKNEWGNIIKGTATADTLTLVASKALPIDIPIKLKCVRK